MRKISVSTWLLVLVLFFGGNSQAATFTPSSQVVQNQPSQTADDLATRVKVGTNPNWVTRCVSDSRKSPLECSMEETLVLTNTGQLVAAVAVKIKSDAEKPLMAIRVPAGISLQAGVNLQIDESKPEPVLLKTCDVQGCYGEMQLNSNQVETLKKGKQLRIAFKNLANSNVSLVLPLDNFANALQKIQ